jgi:hypothetical protein
MTAGRIGSNFAMMSGAAERQTTLTIAPLATSNAASNSTFESRRLGRSAERRIACERRRWFKSQMLGATGFRYRCET